MHHLLPRQQLIFVVSSCLTCKRHNGCLAGTDEAQIWRFHKYLADSRRVFGHSRVPVPLHMSIVKNWKSTHTFDGSKDEKRGC